MELTESVSRQSEAKSSQADQLYGNSRSDRASTSWALPAVAAVVVVDSAAAPLAGRDTQKKGGGYSSCTTAVRNITHKTINSSQSSLPLEKVQVAQNQATTGNAVHCRCKNYTPHR